MVHCSFQWDSRTSPQPGLGPGLLPAVSEGSDDMIIQGEPVEDEELGVTGRLNPGVLVLNPRSTTKVLYGCTSEPHGYIFHDRGPVCLRLEPDLRIAKPRVHSK